MLNNTILALGADMKSKFLMATEGGLFFGPEIGDLSEAGNYESLKRQLRKALKKFQPTIIAHDLHPGYLSTIFAKEHLSLLPCAFLLPVQHHHAHIASVMCEHDLKGPVIGVSFDGTGLGTDGNIWGGEFLIVDKKGFKRAGHLKYWKMPGGDKVITQPWRMALSITGEKGAGFITEVPEKEKELIFTMVSRGINAPLTSSAGRLFDAAAALMGLCVHASYEAEGPIKLESICDKKTRGSYKFKILEENNCDIVDTKDLFAGIIEDMEKREDKGVIAAKFHNSMSKIVVKMVKRLSQKHDIKKVALSGGVFQNDFLKTKVIEGLTQARFKVFINDSIPVNDLNIAVGQYYVSSSSRKG